MAQKKNKSKSAALPFFGIAGKKKAAKAAKPASPAKAAAAKGKPKRPKASPIPKGFTTVSAHLIVQGADRAIEFYTKALGARLKGKMLTPDGRVAHAEMQLGDCRFMLADDFPEWAGGVARAASALPASPVTLHLYVKNADKVFAQAVAAGCEVLMPLSDTFWGDRYGKLKDPFGHEWAVATHLVDMTAKQMQKAMLQAMSAPECAPEPAPSTEPTPAAPAAS